MFSLYPGARAAPDTFNLPLDRVDNHPRSGEAHVPPSPTSVQRMTAQDGRDETEQERMDRKWQDQIQELRVMQTGVQLLAGFLLTLPFQSAFADLDDVQVGIYLGLVSIAAVTTICVVTPVSVHRRLSGQHVKERVVAIASRALATAVAGVALLVVGIVTFIFDVVVDRIVALAVGGTTLVLAAALLGVLPQVLSRDP